VVVGRDLDVAVLGGPADVRAPAQAAEAHRARVGEPAPRAVTERALVRHDRPAHLQGLARIAGRIQREHGKRVLLVGKRRVLDRALAVRRLRVVERAPEADARLLAMKREAGAVGSRDLSGPLVDHGGQRRREIDRPFHRGNRSTVARGVDRAHLEAVRALGKVNGLVGTGARALRAAVEPTCERHAALRVRERDACGGALGRRVGALAEHGSDRRGGVDHQPLARAPAVVVLAPLAHLVARVRARHERVGAVPRRRGHRQLEPAAGLLAARERRNRAAAQPDPPLPGGQHVLGPRRTGAPSALIRDHIGQREHAAGRDRRRRGRERAHNEVGLRRLRRGCPDHRRQRGEGADASQGCRSHARLPASSRTPRPSIC
jgi:hypothetical protein